MARAQRPDEDLRLADLARARVDHRHRQAGVIDEAPLAGHMDLAERGLHRAGPGVIVPAELRVLIPVGRAVLVFGPEQLERDALPLQLRMDRPPVGYRPALGGRGVAREEAGLDPRVIELGWQRPREPRRPEAPQLLVRRALGEPQRAADLALAHVLVEREAEGLEHLSHRNPRCGHRLTPA